MVGAAGMQSRCSSATQRITSIAPEKATSSKNKKDEEKGSLGQGMVATTTFNTSSSSSRDRNEQPVIQPQGDASQEKKPLSSRPGTQGDDSGQRGSAQEQY